jgi:poly(3-hydroxybutyrate) depolymerase
LVTRMMCSLPGGVLGRLLGRRLGRASVVAFALASASLHSVAAHASALTSDGDVVQGAVKVDGYQRGYRLFVPRLAAGERYAGTVVVLHGGGSRESGASIARSVGFDAEAAGRRLIAVYPDARGGRFHAGHCCGRRPTRGDDVRFVVRLLDRVQRRFPVDARRTFATGFSNGAFLAYRLACQQSNRFLGVASVGGTEVLRRAGPSARSRCCTSTAATTPGSALTARSWAAPGSRGRSSSRSAGEHATAARQHARRRSAPHSC